MNVLFLDACGAPWDGQVVREKGIGGSEYAQCQLAEGLARAGVNVHVIVFRDENKAPRTLYGVTYGHGKINAPLTVVASRMTPIPEQFQSFRKIVSLTDAGPHNIAKCDLLVGVSRWQLKHFPGRNEGQSTAVIPPIIEHYEYETHPWRGGHPESSDWCGLCGYTKGVHKIPGKFVYCSGRVKGLDGTLQVWKTLKDKKLIPETAQLHVTTAGWDLPEPGSVEAAGAIWMGLKTPAQIREEIASAQGLFYVNSYPETFCAVAAIAEASGTDPIICCTESPGGLREAVPGLNLVPSMGGAVPLQAMADRIIRAMEREYQGAPQNYSEAKVVGKWLKVL